MKRIGVIGAGPVGLALCAWILRRNPNSQVCLFDKLGKDDTQIVGGDSRGLAISQGSHLLLDSIGAWPTNCPPIHTIHISQKGHFGRTTVRREELGQEALGHIIRYADIHLALRESLRKIACHAPNFTWQYESDFNGINENNFDLVVHAEGGLFQQQDWQDIYRDYEQSAIVGWVKMDRHNHHTAWERFTSEGPLALLPSHLGTDHLNLVWCGTPESTQRRLELNPEVFLLELQDTFGSRAGKFLEAFSLRSYVLGLNARKEIVQGKHVWIGNAAQTLHPVAGQGLNLGLRDAHTLAEQICEHEDSQTALQEYAHLRKIDRKTTIGATDFLARIFTSKLKPIIWTRGLALSSLQILTPLKQTITRQMMFGQR
jgi:2-octaprenyl-6-methoxyphenol hydroxylase